jgi:Putative DNA-binding domain
MAFFEDIPIDELNFEHVEALVNNSRSEGRRIDFKEAFKRTDNGKSRDSHEIAKDVAAFANSSGGDIVYGLIEKDGIAIGTTSVASVEEVEELHNFVQTSVRDGVSPYIDIRCKYIPIGDNSGVYVIRVPKSFQAPHAVRKRGEREALWFFRRGEDSAIPMEESDVRHAYTTGFDIPRQIEIFRRSRIAQSNDTIAGPFFSKSVRVHAFFIPLDSFSKGDHLGYNQLLMGAARLSLESGHSGPIPCPEGAFLHGGKENGIWHAWYLHRNGAVEWTDAGTNYTQNSTQGQEFKKIVYPLYERRLCDRLEDVVSCISSLNIGGPLVFCISLSSAKGAQLILPNNSFMHASQCPIDDIHAQTLIVKSASDLNPDIIKPAFDHVMNAFGVQKSLNYDVQGRYNSK